MIKESLGDPSDLHSISVPFSDPLLAPIGLLGLSSDLAATAKSTLGRPQRSRATWKLGITNGKRRHLGKAAKTSDAGEKPEHSPTFCVLLEEYDFFFFNIVA